VYKTEIGPVIKWRESSGDEWSVLFAGDLCPIGRIEAQLLEGETESVFTPPVLEQFREADFVCVNLESPLCGIGSPIRKIGPNFRASPKIAGLLKKAGIHCAALANNHIMDQGTAGLKETLEYLEKASIRYHGAGLSHASAALPVVIDASVGPAAFFNVAEGEFARAQGDGPGAARFSAVENLPMVMRASQKYPFVIVTIHAGNEHMPFPAPYYQERYRALIDAGADIIIAHHPHIVQGIERYGNGIICYSLGNFLFDYPGHTGLSHTEIGFLAEVSFDAKGPFRLKIIPYRKSRTAGADLLRKPDDVKAFFDYLNNVSSPLKSSERLSVLWEQEAVKIFRSSHSGLLKDNADMFLEDREKAGYRQTLFYNLFRCDAHRISIQTALKILHEGRWDHVSGCAETELEIESLKKKISNLGLGNQSE